MSDRRKEYITRNLSICEDICIFVAYNYETAKAICSCPISINLLIVSYEKIDIEKLKANFINLKNIANIEVLKCYHLLFSGEIRKNIGFIIILLIFIFGLISLIVFYSYGYNLLKNNVINIIRVKLSENKALKTTKSKNRGKVKTTRKKSNKNIVDTIKTKARKNKLKSLPINSPTKKANNQAPPKKIIKSQNSNNCINIKQNINIKNLSIKSTEQINKGINNTLQLFNNNFNQLKSIKINLNKQNYKFNDTELNFLSYKEAIEKDKRSYCQYYISLIRTKHLLIFAFLNNNDYNSRLIKINLFFFTFALNYAINALFFNDSNMHKIYEDEGKFDINYQLPKIIYSSFICSIIIMIVKLLALSEKIILDIINSNVNNINKNFKSDWKLICYKFIGFFILVFIFLLIFCYYIGCFCAVYKNTQIYLLIDTLTSFITSLIYPFALYLLPGIIRIQALNNKKKDRECEYKISRFLQASV